MSSTTIPSNDTPILCHSWLTSLNELNQEIYYCIDWTEVQPFNDVSITNSLAISYSEYILITQYLSAFFAICIGFVILAKGLKLL